MRLRKNQSSFVLPVDVYDVLNITICNHLGLLTALQRISPTLMERLQREQATTADTPRNWSLHDNKLSLFPKPDRDYENMEVVYLAPPNKL